MQAFGSVRTADADVKAGLARKLVRENRANLASHDRTSSFGIIGSAVDGASVPLLACKRRKRSDPERVE